MNSPFFIGAFPRSRTAWVCNYFTAHGHLCLHEPLLQTKSIHATLDLIEKLGCGICDSTVPLMWPQIIERFPNSRFAFIRRLKWTECPAVNGVSEDIVTELEMQAARMVQSAIFPLLDFAELDQKIARLADYCIPDFKKNPLIHNQCLRFHVQLTDKALAECRDPANFAVTIERKEAA